VRCQLDRAADDRSQAGYRAVVAAVLDRRAGVQQLDPTAMLCDARQCPVVADGKVYYRDKDHLSRFGSLALADSLWSGLAAVPRNLASSGGGP
jgi:hypothetical protein